jgi:hypothetical protein
VAQVLGVALGTWETTNLDPSGAGCPANFYPAPFFWRGPAEGSWPHRRWLQIISLDRSTIKIGGGPPVSGQEIGKFKGYTHPLYVFNRIFIAKLKLKH